MSATIFDTSPLIKQLTQKIERALSFLAEKNISPGVALIHYNPNTSEEQELKALTQWCNRFNIRQRRVTIQKKNPLKEIAQNILTLNENKQSHGIVLNGCLSLRSELEHLYRIIRLEKDVAKVNPSSCLELLQGLNNNLPPFVETLFNLLKFYKVELAKKRICVIGQQSNLGKPLVLALANRGYVVTSCHHNTPHLEFHTRQAEVVIQCEGPTQLIESPMLAPHAHFIQLCREDFLAHNHEPQDQVYTLDLKLDGLNRRDLGLYNLTQLQVVWNTVRAAGHLTDNPIV